MKGTLPRLDEVACDEWSEVILGELVCGGFV